MCKKLAKIAKDSEAMRDQLAKYHSLYGEVDASLTVEEVASDVANENQLATQLIKQKYINDEKVVKVKDRRDHQSVPRLVWSNDNFLSECGHFLNFPGG